MPVSLRPGSCLCQVRSLAESRVPRSRKGQRQGRGDLHRASRLTQLSHPAHLTAERSPSSDYAAWGWAGLESRGRDRGRGLKHQVWGFYAPECSPELGHFSGVSWNHHTPASAVSGDPSESQGWCKIVPGTTIHVIIKYAKGARIRARGKEPLLSTVVVCWKLQGKTTACDRIWPAVTGRRGPAPGPSLLQDQRWEGCWVAQPWAGKPCVTQLFSVWFWAWHQIFGWWSGCNSTRLACRGAFMIIRNNQIQITEIGAREY